MTAAEFKKWTARHCAIFAFDMDATAPTFAEWFKVFAQCGYTAADLNAATDVIARRTEPLSWLRDHLSAIHSAIRNIRLDSRRPFYAEMYKVSEAEIERAKDILAPYLRSIGRVPRRDRVRKI